MVVTEPALRGDGRPNPLPRQDRYVFANFRELLQATSTQKCFDAGVDHYMSHQLIVKLREQRPAVSKDLKIEQDQTKVSARWRQDAHTFVIRACVPSVAFLKSLLQ